MLQTRRRQLIWQLLMSACWASHRYMARERVSMVLKSEKRPYFRMVIGFCGDLITFFASIVQKAVVSYIYKYILNWFKSAYIVLAVFEQHICFAIFLLLTTSLQLTSFKLWSYYARYALWLENGARGGNEGRPFERSNTSRNSKIRAPGTYRNTIIS